MCASTDKFVYFFEFLLITNIKSASELIIVAAMPNMITQFRSEWVSLVVSTFFFEILVILSNRLSKLLWVFVSIDLLREFFECNRLECATVTKYAMQTNMNLEDFWIEINFLLNFLTDYLQCTHFIIIRLTRTFTTEHKKWNWKFLVM